MLLSIQFDFIKYYMRLITIALLFISNVIIAQTTWPVLKHYEGENIDKIAMPVGGIGTGDISIAGNGQWQDVEMMNKPGMGFYGAASPKEAPCFMIFTQQNGEKKSKTLTGPIALSEYAG